MRQLSNSEFDNLRYFAFEKVANHANIVQHSLESLREGTATPGVLSEDETLKTYRETLKQAVAKLDSVIDS